MAVTTGHDTTHIAGQTEQRTRTRRKEVDHVVAFCVFWPSLNASLLAMADRAPRPAKGCGVGSDEYFSTAPSREEELKMQHVHSVRNASKRTYDTSRDF